MTKYRRYKTDSDFAKKIASLEQYMNENGIQLSVIAERIMFEDESGCKAFLTNNDTNECLDIFPTEFQYKLMIAEEWM